MSAQGQLFVPANLPDVQSRKPSDLLPDVCRTRHGGNPQSELCNARLHPHKGTLREAVYGVIERSQGRGASLSEICKELNKLPHQISGRISELFWHEKKIKLSGATRLNDRGNSEAVYVSVGQ